MKKTNKKVLAPIRDVPLPSGPDSSDDEPPSYLEIALTHHDKVKQTFVDRNRLAHANPIPSALVAPKPQGRLRQNPSILVAVDDPA